MTYIKTLILLLILNWTASYGQTGDSLTCYTNGELKKIANAAVYATECDTLLEIQDRQLETRNEKILNQQDIIASRDSIIAAQDTIASKHDLIIEVKDDEIADLKRANKKLSNRLVATKVMWAGSVGGLLILWVLTALP